MDEEVKVESTTVEKKKSSSKAILALRWIIFLAFMLIIGANVIRVVSKAYFTRHIVIEVTDKAVKNNKYMVYGKTITEDHLPKSYEITDSILARRYDSSDLYAEIEVGKTYEMIVGGNRVPLMSWYPNIYEVLEIEVPNKEKPLPDETEAEGPKI